MKKHLGYYLCQIGFITIILIVLSQIHDNVIAQIALVITLGIFYAGWGIIHHALHHTLQLKIVLEYSTIALFGLSIIFLVMKGVL